VRTTRANHMWTDLWHFPSTLTLSNSVRAASRCHSPLYASVDSDLLGRVRQPCLCAIVLRRCYPGRHCRFRLLQRVLGHRESTSTRRSRPWCEAKQETRRLVRRHVMRDLITQARLSVPRTLRTSTIRQCWNSIVNLGAVHNGIPTLSRSLSLPEHVHTHGGPSQQHRINVASSLANFVLHCAQ
jgi:hypothetical protein